jgi:hypothetical protein
MTWFPPWRWFVSPSGGPIAPGLLGFLDGVKRRPLIAHPVGAALLVWAFVRFLHSAPAPAIGAALLAEAVNQFYKAVRGVYGATLWLNVVWRLVLALAGALVAWWVVG